MQEKFEWSPGAGADPLYPMEIYRCGFVYADGDGVSPAAKALLGGVWGTENGSSVVGDREKPVPVELQISWLSYTENKFYRGHFKLPYDKMLKLFQQGIKTFDFEEGKGMVPNRYEYDDIVAGLAPGGVVVVWVEGAGSTIDVGRFQVDETKIDMMDFAPDAWTHDQNKYVEGMMGYEKAAVANLAKNRIPLGLWDRYRERFNQRPIIKFDQSHPVETGAIYLGYFNGEAEVNYDEKYQKNYFKPRARVKIMNLGWTDTYAGKSQDYALHINFDEREMFKAYKEAYGNKPEQEGQLVVEINRGNDRYKVYLKVGDKKIEMLKHQGEIMFDNRNK
ncbi:DUF2931 family protein [Pedobacter sp. UYP30]|uniref:DUF2931 family protein n=1 Tax=Pedobacter sp. UYP30 TaxID=1756400 RepID=UPI003391ED11